MLRERLDCVCLKGIRNVSNNGQVKTGSSEGEIGHRHASDSNPVKHSRVTIYSYILKRNKAQ